MNDIDTSLGMERAAMTTHFEFSNFAEALASHAAHSPDKIAVVDPWSAQILTYGALDHAARSIAGALAGQVPAGSAIGLATTPDIRAFQAYAGIAYAGMAPALLPTPEMPTQIHEFVPLAEHWRTAVPTALMVDATDFALSEAAHADHWFGSEAPLRIERLLEADVVPIAGPIPSSPTAPGHWIFSSGTTGPAKAIRLSRKAIAFNLSYTARSWSFDSNSRVVGNGTPFHSAGLMVGYLMPLFVGASAVLLPPARFSQNPGLLLDTISRHEVTHLACADSMIDRLLREASHAFATADLSAFQCVVIGGEPLSHDTFRDISKALRDNNASHVTVGTAFGMTEAAGLISTSGRQHPETGHFAVNSLSRGHAKSVDDPSGRFVASGGSASYGVTVCVVDDAGMELPSGCVGRVVFQSPSLFDCYEGEASATLTVRRRRSGELQNGFFATGDLGFVLKGRYGDEIAIVGREKEMICIGSRRYHGLDIETAIELACPELSLDQIIAVGDPDDAARILVLIEDPQQAPLEDLIHRVHDALARTFPDTLVRVAITKRKSFPWIPTSSKKPRIRARQAFEDSKLPILMLALPANGTDGTKSFVAGGTKCVHM